MGEGHMRGGNASTALRLDWLWLVHMHSKKCWVVSTQIWGKYGQTRMLG